jgi:hypothetical protein
MEDRTQVRDALKKLGKDKKEYIDKKIQEIRETNQE